MGIIPENLSHCIKCMGRWGDGGDAAMGRCGAITLGQQTASALAIKEN